MNNIQWIFAQALLLIGVVFLALYILAVIVPPLCEALKVSKIPVSGKHLDELESIDRLYIFINKAMSALFAYHVIHVTTHTSSIKWEIGEVTVSNTVGSVLLFFVFYDFFYHQIHQIIHHRWIYHWIHKHHHRQHSPSRGNPDGINAHPIEFFIFEYLHLLTVWVIPCHIYAVVLFISLGAFMASLSHTRYDVQWSFIFKVSDHDVHHHFPESNFSLYTMLWDR
ncbi:MAG: sterol desaturase family protein, partial [Cyanobacteria bacterium]|nr:sterol desaturase family protein [Cyanobacteriota bacterium]